MQLQESHIGSNEFQLVENKTSEGDIYKLLKNENINTRKTLVVAHGYFRNGDFYKNISEKILEEGVYDEIVLFDFSGHDGGKTEMSFKESLNRMERIIEELDNESISIWGHSYGALVSTFVGKMSEHPNYDSKKIDELILTSLPYSINEQFVTKKGMKKLNGKKNQDLKWFPKKGIDDKGNLIIGNLTVKDIGEYSQNFMKVPTLEHLGDIKIPTKIIRARADFALGVGTIMKDGKPIFIGTPNKVKKYKALQDYFKNVKNYSINFGGHGLKVPETNKESSPWESYYKELIKIIVDKK